MGTVQGSSEATPVLHSPKPLSTPKLLPFLLSKGSKTLNIDLVPKPQSIASRLRPPLPPLAALLQPGGSRTSPAGPAPAPGGTQGGPGAPAAGDFGGGRV